MKFTEEIRLFEQRLGCRAAFHDYTGEITRLATPAKLPLHHSHPCCEEIRNRSESSYESCLACDVHLVGRTAAWKRPFWKTCHAGLQEAVFPLLKFDAPAGVLFLGVYRPSPHIVPSVEQQAGTPPSRPPAEEPPDDLLWFGSLFCESIRLRLEQRPESDLRGGRKARIHWWFERNFRRSDASLGDLAAELGVSESRASQLLREENDGSFPKLLNRYRLEYAREILARSRLSVAEVAGLVGYHSANYLFRQYRNCYGVTPRNRGGN